MIIALVNAWMWLRHPRLVRMFLRRVRLVPNIAWPTTFNEKIFWRKLFDRDPLFGTLVDKLQVRAWMIARCPELRGAPLRWTGTRAEDIPEGALAGGAAVKTNHGSGFNIFLREAPTDRAALNAQVNAWLALPGPLAKGEWAYGCVRRQVYVEALLPSLVGNPLVDLGIHCCDGRVLSSVPKTGDRTADERVAYFRPDGTRIDVVALGMKTTRPMLADDFAMPPSYAEAVRVAAILSRGIDYVRVDLMAAGDALYAGEMTLYPRSGASPLSSLALGQEIAASWDLRKSWFLTAPQRGWRKHYARALRRRLDREAQRAPRRH